MQGVRHPDLLTPAGHPAGPLTSCGHPLPRGTLGSSRHPLPPWHPGLQGSGSVPHIRPQPQFSGQTTRSLNDGQGGVCPPAPSHTPGREGRGPCLETAAG